MKATGRESPASDKGQKKEMRAAWYRNTSLRKFLAYVLMRIIFLVIRILLERTN